MRTPEEIKSWFEKPAVISPFGAAKKRATLAYIEQLEKKNAAAQARIEELDTNISLMKIQMEGYCGACKNREKRELCKECMIFPYHPYWEYEGLPELPKKGASS